jgi:hypothetical protein
MVSVGVILTHQETLYEVSMGGHCASPIDCVWFLWEVTVPSPDGCVWPLWEVVVPSFIDCVWSLG